MGCCHVAATHWIGVLPDTRASGPGHRPNACFLLSKCRFLLQVVSFLSGSMEPWLRHVPLPVPKFPIQTLPEPTIRRPPRCIPTNFRSARHPAHIPNPTCPACRIPYEFQIYSRPFTSLTLPHLMICSLACIMNHYKAPHLPLSAPITSLLALSDLVIGSHAS